MCDKSEIFDGNKLYQTSIYRVQEDSGKRSSVQKENVKGALRIIAENRVLWKEFVHALCLTKDIQGYKVCTFFEILDIQRYYRYTEPIMRLTIGYGWMQIERYVEYWKKGIIG